MVDRECGDALRGASKAKTMRTEADGRPDATIREVARWQKAILWLILVRLGTGRIPGAFVVASLIGAYFVYRLGKALGSAWTIPVALLAFIPFIGLIPLLILNAEATKALQARGVHVGLMGARRADLDRLAT